MTISVYSTSSEVQERLCGELIQIAQELKEQCVTESFNRFSDFLESGRCDSGRILLLAEKGAVGVELAASTVEECPENKMIWLSDLDFALFSYRLEITYFGLLPAKAETIRLALKKCQHKKCLIREYVQ